jgi:ubiquinone/menaquinone biosynthesis C-methylase UbiE
MSVLFEIHSGNLREGPGSFDSTKKAISYLNELTTNPKILDVGCGPGQQSIDLAKLTKGNITSIDNHQPYLDSLSRRVINQGLEYRITILNRDMSKLNFEPNSFDLIWSEGAIYNIGFENGLRLWKPLLKSNGYIAVTEISWLKETPPKELQDFWLEAYPKMKYIENNLEIIKKCGYKSINNFTLPESDWWNYYTPILEKINLLKEKYKNKKQVLETIDLELKEIDIYKRYCEYYGYEFYIMQVK